MSKKENTYEYFQSSGKPIGYYDFTNKYSAVKSYVEYMLSRTQQMFKYNNLPETIPQIFLERFLQRNGHCCIAKYEDELYCFTGSFGGFPDVYYMPTLYIVANPALKMYKSFSIYSEKKLTLIDNDVNDGECVLIRNDSEFQGLIPLCNRYASLLVENDITMRQENINARIPVIAAVHGDTQKVALDMMINRVEKGDMSIAVSDSFDETLRTMPYSTDKNRTTELIEFHQYCKGAWYNELGLKASFNMKREAISEAEASMNDDILLPLVDNMLTCRKCGINQVNKVFGTNITVELNSVWEDIIDERDAALEVIKSEISSNENDNSIQVEDDERSDSDVSDERFSGTNS